MMFIVQIAVITGCLAFALSAQAALSPEAQKLAAANAGFSFKLLKEITKEQPEKNVFISPYSVSTVLQMVENGAGGKTKEEMRQTLGITALSQTAQNTANRELSQLIHAATSNMVLTTANAVWYRKGIAIKPDFITVNQQSYQATVAALNFDDPASVGIINSWVSDQTHGRIPGMLSGPIDPATYLYLANAVYFKGEWMKPFDAKDTKDREFHLRGGNQKKLPMMNQGGSFSYRRGTGYQAVRLPYEGWNLGMYVFLPDTNSSPEKLLAIMNGDNWQRITKPGFSERDGTLMLPRFKFEYGVDLVRPLQALGIKSAFAQTANFNALCNEPVFISKARQKTFVEVNEKGTEAAAVTMMQVDSMGMPMEQPKPFEMIVDRPFLVVIEDSESKTILFMGVIFDPAEAN